jgi:hypothetical protein
VKKAGAMRTPYFRAPKPQKTQQYAEKIIPGKTRPSRPQLSFKLI